MALEDVLSETFGHRRQLRRRRTAVDVQARYQELRLEHRTATAAAIRRTLAAEFNGSPDVPSERTIREWLKRDGVPEPAKPWALGSFESDRTAAILGVLRELVSQEIGNPGSEAPRWSWWTQQLSEDEARWVAQIRLSVPDVPATFVQVLARLYWIRSINERDTRDLDIFLAFAPWDAERGRRYQAAIDAGEASPPPASLQGLFNSELVDHQTLNAFPDLGPIDPKLVKAATAHAVRRNKEGWKREGRDDE